MAKAYINFQREMIFTTYFQLCVLRNAVLSLCLLCCNCLYLYDVRSDIHPCFALCALLETLRVNFFEMLFQWHRLLHVGQLGN